MKKSILLVLVAAAFTALGCDESPLVATDGAGDATTPVPKRGAENGGAYERWSSVINIADGSTVGLSRLARGKSHVSAVLRTSGIPDGHALTTWWVVFNNPDACATSPCDEPDLFDPAVEADILYADGKVAQNGHVTFTGTLRENQVRGSVADVFAMPAASGMHDAETAEIHLIVRSHGPAVPGGILDEQITTLNGGCDVELPLGVMPTNVGECADIQFAVHEL